MPDTAEKMVPTSLYTARRCRKKTPSRSYGANDLHGPTHGSMDCHITLCGLPMDENWYVLTNGFDGEITCKKCQQKLVNSAGL